VLQTHARGIVVRYEGWTETSDRVPSRGVDVKDRTGRW